MKLPSNLKSQIRRVSRRFGYEIVPSAVGLGYLQRSLLPQIDVVIDVGANVGQYAERLWDMGFAGQIISFEPGFEAFRDLKVRSDRFGTRWQSRRVALSDAPGTATLQVSGNSVSSSLLEVAEEHLRAAPDSRIVARESVEVSTLDRQLAGVGGVYWLKLDVQGLELQVLHGADAVLERTAVVQAEISFAELYSGQADWLTVCHYLQNRGYVMRYLEPGYEDPQSGYMLQADVLFVRPGLIPVRE